VIEPTLPVVTCNLRFLLWRAGIAREQWATQLAGWIGGDPQRGTALLQGRTLPVPAELDQLASSTGRDAGEIQFGDFTAEISILEENLRYLVEAPKRGQKKVLAEHLAISQVTFSRWLAGKQQPARKYLAAIRKYFGLPASIDLENDPLFLELSPVGSYEQRAWLRQRVDELDDETLRVLFPALERLLRQP